MSWSVKMVAVAVVCAPPVWACCQVAGQSLAPGDGARIPANTRFFVDGERPNGRVTVSDEGGTRVELHGALERAAPDGAVVALQPIESGEGDTRFYAPGVLRPGETFFLSDAGVRVEVVAAAEPPSATGQLVFGAAYSGAAWCDLYSPPRKFVREVFLQPAADTQPWRAVGRVRFTQRAFLDGAVVFEPQSQHFGALASAVEGFGVPVGRLVADCDEFPGRHVVELEARFEAPGMTQAAPAQQQVVMDCAERPPVGCSQAPVGLLGALSLLLFSRRRGAGARRR